MERRLNQIAEGLGLPDLPADESADVVREVEQEIQRAQTAEPGESERTSTETPQAAERRGGAQ
jgi:hypothetical protein